MQYSWGDLHPLLLVVFLNIFENSGYKPKILFILPIGV